MLRNPPKRAGFSVCGSGAGRRGAGPGVAIEGVLSEFIAMYRNHSTRAEASGRVSADPLLVTLLCV